MKVLHAARLALIAFVISLVPASSYAGVFVSINIAPPVMPVYEQPVCPEVGYMWTPGYWAYGPDGYYWVPGAWVPAPEPGLLWTPPYWGYEGSAYIFHAGYWGPHVGYYGGVNYGFGYMGIGFAGGEWRGGSFFYNTAVMHVGVGGGWAHNTYVNQTIIHNTTIINNNRVAYSGGPHGINHPPSAQERQFSNERHIAPTAVQTQHIQAAARNPEQRFSANHGRPATVASARPVGAEHGAPAARGGAQEHNNGAGARPENRQMTAPHTPANQVNHPQESRPVTQAHPATQARPQTESRPAARPEQQARPESHPAQQARPESRPAPAAHPQTHSAPAPHAAPHPAPRPAEHPHGHGR